MERSGVTGDDIEHIVRLLATIHDGKGKVYKGSWKKHGELVSIFANISRKVDRLEVVWESGEATPDETTVDTVADLAVYALLYLGWLNKLDTTRDEGFSDSTYHVAAWLAEEAPDVWTPKMMRERIADAYDHLEIILVRDATKSAWHVNASAKKLRAKALAGAAIAWLALARASGDAAYRALAETWGCA